MPKRRASRDHRARFVVVEHRKHHQHRIGAGDARLDDLARIDEEILGQDRAGEIRRARRKIGRASRRKQRPSMSTLSASATAGIAARDQLPTSAPAADRPRDGDAFLISRMKRAPGCAIAAAG